MHDSLFFLEGGIQLRAVGWNQEGECLGRETERLSDVCRFVF